MAGVVPMGLHPVPAEAAGLGQYGAPEWLPLRSAPGGGELRVGCTYKSPYLPQQICNDEQTGALEYHPYWALDLAVNQGGASVYAAGAGQLQVNPLPASYGYGTHIVIDHGAHGRSLYAHLASVDVADDDWVDQNTRIGVVGATGSTGGTDHLHYEYNDANGGWGRSGSPNDPGDLKACHGSSLVTYGDWQGLAWGTRWVHSNGTNCESTNPVDDGDGDGVADSSDRCPHVWGASQLDGCPYGSSESAGDFDGDGFADLATGTPNQGSQAGQVTVVYGSAGGATSTRVATFTQASGSLSGAVEAGDHLGAATAVGDFDGDGYADLAISAPGENARAGRVHVVYGSSAGLTTSRVSAFTQNPDSLSGDAESGDELGAALAAGDFDGDGRSDLGIGSSGENARAGRVHVVYGSLTGLTTSRVSAFTQDASSLNGGAESGDRLGASLAAGDFDGDGRSDLGIGSPGENARNQSAGVRAERAISPPLRARGGLELAG